MSLKFKRIVEQLAYVVDNYCMCDVSAGMEDRLHCSPDTLLSACHLLEKKKGYKVVDFACKYPARGNDKLQVRVFNILCKPEVTEVDVWHCRDRFPTPDTLTEEEAERVGN